MSTERFELSAAASIAGAEPAFEAPIVHCPRCGAAYEDFDGFGVVYCGPSNGCGYCRHLSRDNGRCNYCGDRRCPECGNREINATETVCLACSNRAWSDR